MKEKITARGESHRGGTPQRAAPSVGTVRGLRVLPGVFIAVVFNDVVHLYQWRLQSLCFDGAFVGFASS